MSTRIEAFQEHREASRQLISAAKTELSVRVAPEQRQAPTKERRQTIGSSPTRRRKSSVFGAVGTSPNRGPGKAQRRRSPGAGSALAAEDRPLEQLLQRLTLSLPDGGDGDPQDGGGGEGGGVETRLSREQVSFLAATLAERTAKAADVARNVQESFETAATTQLGDARLALQMVRDSLLAESPYGRVRLVDPEIEGSLEFLEKELEKMRERLGGVEDELVKARGRKGKREEIVKRWGR